MLAHTHKTKLDQYCALKFLAFGGAGGGGGGYFEGVCPESRKPCRNPSLPKHY